ncbi:MAG TPA: 3'-5' exonuclease, partial [Limnochordia bacterium]|nr:3'-5' exonuclease [Limnochordia bacterium]
AQTGLGLLDACGDAAAIAPLGPAYTKRVLEFHRLIDGLARRVESLSVTALTEAVLQESGYMHELVEEKTLEAEGRIENLREFLSVTKQYEEENGANATLDGFLEHVDLISDVDAYDQSAECVTLMSLHAAKGLEFDAIFLVGMEDGVFPHSRAIWEPGELEEERRLCYVGMTRARKRLYLTCARQRTLFGQLRANDASRFLDELPREVIEDVSPERERQRAGIGSAGYALGGERYGSAERGAGARGEGAPGGAGERAADQAAAAADDFTAGDKVRHDSWGEGTVVQVDRSGRDAILAIAFPSQGIKRVMVGIAPIRKLG